MNRSFVFMVPLALLFTPSLVVGEDSGRAGSVDFAFDGGTLRCEFGTKDLTAKPIVAIIVYPTTAKERADVPKVVMKPGTPGSAVIVRDADGVYRQLDRDAVMEWAKQRVSKMSERRPSIAENAFVATVAHTVTTGETVRVWGFDGVKLLESGNWTGLFNPTVVSDEDKTPQVDPFK